MSELKEKVIVVRREGMRERESYELVPGDVI
jgi:hypothetical protein